VVRGFRAKAAKSRLIRMAECGNNNVGPAGSEDLGPGAERRRAQSNAARVGGSLGCCTQIGQVAGDAPRAHRRCLSRVAEALTMAMEADDEMKRAGRGLAAARALFDGLAGKSLGRWEASRLVREVRG